MNGAVPYGRSDSLSQQTGLAARSLLSRDSDHNPLYNEKRERATGSDKERVNLRAVNKYVNKLTILTTSVNFSPDLICQIFSLYSSS